MAEEFGRKAKCEVCGLDKEHSDVADCMLDLMDYIKPEIRKTDAFRRVLLAGQKGMRKQIEEEKKRALAEHAPVAW